MYQDYYYSKDIGDGYRYNIIQKCFYTIGREPIAMMNTPDNKTMLRFDPSLSSADELLIADLFSDSSIVSKPPVVTVQNNKYQIKDIYEFRQELTAACGFEVQVWFGKSSSKVSRPDIVELQFGNRLLTISDKKKVVDAIKKLTIGWI